MLRRHILITGATGLLGGAVLFEALQSHPDIAWTALVRGEDEAAARARVVARLARFSDMATAIRLLTPVRIIAGDLLQVDMLDPALLAGTTHILHLAADTSHWSRAANWRVNFDGTLALARAAERMSDLLRFLHVGTATICGTDPNPLVLEDDYPRDGVEHLVHYTRAKAAAEVALVAQFPRLPVVVARPSIVAGNATLGSRPSSSIFWFVRCAVALGLVSCDPRGGIDIVPSDWAGSALLHLLLKPELAHRTYHLSAGVGSRCTWSALIDAFAAIPGEDPPQMPVQFAMDQPAVLRDRFATRFGLGDARLALMLKAARNYYGFAALDVTFDNSRLLAEGMTPPPPLPEYLGICLAEPAGQSILDAFLDDADMFDPTPLSSSIVAA